MLLRIEHKIAWELPEPARFSIHYLRLWPTNEPTQAVVDWQVETRGRAAPFTDGYGNSRRRWQVDGAADGGLYGER